MSAKVGYFRLGVFILTAFGLLVTAILILGVGTAFKSKVMVETYLDESAQGLSVGSPFKFRGVQIGSIEKIDFANNKYKDIHSTEHRYVLIEIAVNPTAFGPDTLGRLKKDLPKEIQRGLRVRLAPQGITGTAFLEMNYLDPMRYPVLPLDWEPEHIYVPSAPGAFARLEETMESLTKTLGKLEQAKIDQILVDFNDLLLTLRDGVKAIRFAELSGEGASLLTELRETNRKVGKLIGETQPSKTGGKADLESKTAAQAVAEVAAAAKKMNEVAASLSDAFVGKNGQPGALSKTGKLVERLEVAAAELPELLANLRQSSKELPGATTAARVFLDRATEILITRQEELEEAARNAERASRDLKEAAGEARRNPSGLIFGDPPRPVRP